MNACDEIIIVFIIVNVFALMVAVATMFDRG